MKKLHTPEKLLTPAEVAATFNVAATAGKLGYVTTLGGHRRYAAAEVQALLNGSRQARGSR